jgi:predicted DCC family thiol-disulfide oxidoreductase YuxK
MVKNTEKLVILYDGVCNLCSATVTFILRVDYRKRFRFAALQSRAGSRLRKQYNLGEHLYSVILIDKGKVYDKSTAVLMIVQHLGFPWRLFSLLRHFPRRHRDRFYAYIARKRYNWFGTRDRLRLDSPGFKNRFL